MYFNCHGMISMRKVRTFPVAISLACLAVSCGRQANSPVPEAARRQPALTSYMAKGLIKELKPDENTVVIQHEAISNYMVAMTMPFRVKDPGEIAHLERGDLVTFRLLVSANESWIDEITKTGHTNLAKEATDASSRPVPVPQVPMAATSSRDDFTFTNEFGQAVNLKQMNGQALALTFFFTRCPIPEYCPRLSKSFAEASRKLSALTNAPTNWHLFSVSFDSQFDTPPVLRAYAERYSYDSNHWSFLTGPPDRIAKLTKLFGFQFEPDGAFFKHEFRTAVIDTTGHLVRMYPFVGDISDFLVQDLLKAATPTNHTRQSP